MFATVTDIKRLHLSIVKATTATSKGDSNPLEAYIKLDARDGNLRITGLDSTSHQMTLTVPANIAQEGFVLVRQDMIVKRIGALDSQPVNVHRTDENMLRFEQQFGVHDFPVYGGTATDYPELVDLPPVAATLSADHFKMLLGRLKGIKADPDQRCELVFESGQMTAYTSSLGLFYRHSIPLEQSMEDLLVVSVPIGTLAKMPDFSDTLSIHHGPGLTAFRSAEGEFWVRCMDLPTYNRRIDQLFDANRVGYWVTKAKAFATKLAGAAGDAPSHIEPQRSTNTLHISVRNQVEGSSRMTIGIDDINGETPPIWANVNNLRPALAALKSELAMVEYLSHRDQHLMRLRNEDDPMSPKILIMPTNPVT